MILDIETCMTTTSPSEDYDVVLDTLQKHHDKLWSITKSNMTSEFLGMGIMDDIRLEQMSQLKEAMDLWRRRDELREYEFMYKDLFK